MIQQQDDTLKSVESSKQSENSLIPPLLVAAQ